MPIRNPFRRAPGTEATDEAQRTGPDNGFKDTAVSGAQPMQIKDSTEYKLSGETCCDPRAGGRPMRFICVGAYHSIRNQRQRRVSAGKIPRRAPRHRDHAVTAVITPSVAGLY